MKFQSELSGYCPNLVEPPADPVVVWVHEIHPPKTLRDRLWSSCNISHFRKPSEALSFIREFSEIKGILVIPVIKDNQSVVLEMLKDVCLLNEVEDPARIEVFLPLMDELPHDLMEKFRSLGAEIRWGLEAEDAARCINYLRWHLLRAPERKVTLELTYPDPDNLRLVLCGPRGRADYQIGERLKRTIETLDEYGKEGVNTRQFADELRVSIKTPKKYMKELRNEHDRIRLSVGETIPGNKVFISELLPGGWRFRLAAKIEKPKNHPQRSGWSVASLQRMR